MKKSLRIASALILAVVLGTMIAAPASAKTLFVSQEVATLVPNSPKALEPRNPPSAPGAIVYKLEKNVYTSMIEVPDCWPGYTVSRCYPTAGDVLYGGKYYSLADGRAAVSRYFANNNHEIRMVEGERRSICDGVYFYSSDPKVAYYDYDAGKLVAVKHGTAEISVYTRGGVPVCRLTVYVLASTFLNPIYDSLILTPDTWNPSIGSTVNLSVRSASGAVYNDLIFTVDYPYDRATVGEKTGKVTVNKNGPVFVHARSASDDRIWGETLLYAGSLTAAICDGGWSVCSDGIRVSNWGYDIYDIWGSQNACVNGWICASGMYLPVIKSVPATTCAPVTTVPCAPVTTIGPTPSFPVSTITPGASLSYLDLLRLCYGDRSSLTSLIGQYNIQRYGASGIVVNAYDYQTLYTAYLLGLLLNND